MAALFSLLACAGTEKNVSGNGEYFLAKAIDALSNKSECRESDFSTEDEEILSAIKRRDFEVVEHFVDSQDGEAYHRFTLKRRAASEILIAEVVVVDGRCQEYTFGKIVD